MAAQDTLLYFSSRGRAEAIRMLYLMAGKEFNDTRTTNEKWPQERRGRLVISIQYACYCNSCPQQVSWKIVTESFCSGLFAWATR